MLRELIKKKLIDILIIKTLVKDYQGGIQSEIYLAKEKNGNYLVREILK